MKTGQINLNTIEGDWIYKISSLDEVNTIVEIGTWNGCGSTMCVIQSLIDNKKEKDFTSIELYPDMYEQAKDNLKEYSSYVKLLNGRIIDYNDCFWFDHSIVDFNSDMHAQLYFEKDLNYIKEVKNVISELPTNIDLLILDGGQWTTYPEWIVLKDRVNYVILDDTQLLKTERIREEILSSGEFITIFDDLNLRYGFSIFKKINIK